MSTFDSAHPPRHFRPSPHRWIGVGAALAAIMLSACAPLIIGGAVGTAVVVSDRRTSGAQLEDQSIEAKASKRISDTLGERVHVNINAYNRFALITGEVPNDADRAHIEQIVAHVENVKGVDNELAISGISSITSRSNDVLIATKVRATLVDAKDVISSAFKIVVERGEVYLMGIVTEREANRAVELTRSIKGVHKVVRVFEIVSEDELAGIQPPVKPASQP